MDKTTLTVIASVVSVIADVLDSRDIITRAELADVLEEFGNRMAGAEKSEHQGEAAGSNEDDVFAYEATSDPVTASEILVAIGRALVSPPGRPFEIIKGGKE
jgi:hypothetical protein